MKSGMKLAVAAFSVAVLPVCGFADNAFSGIQVGANLGYEDASMDWETQSFSSAFGPGTFAAEGDDSESMDDSAATYGVFAAYNMAINPQWVVGLELAYQARDISDTIGFVPGFGDGGNNLTRSEVEVNDSFLFGVKGGYLLDETSMVYSTLSATMTEVESSSYCPSDGFICNPGSAPKSFKDDDDITGWALAVGFEKALDEHLSVKAEYRYADLGTAELSPVTQEFDESFGVEADVDVISQSLQVGVAYKF